MLGLRWLSMATLALATMNAVQASAQYVGEPGSQPPPFRPDFAKMAIPPDPAPLPSPLPPRGPQSESEGGDCKGLGCPPTEIAIAQQLLASGPDPQNIYDTFETPAPKLAVVGFVRQNWPLAIEYAAEPDTVTILRIRLYHHRKLLIFPLPFFEVAFEQILDALPSETGADPSSRRLVKIPEIKLSATADPTANSDLRVARYDVRSYRVANGQVEKKNGRPVRVPVDVIGIAAGHDVVGSLTLLNARFSETSQRLPAQGAPPLNLAFSYQTDRYYDLIKESIQIHSDADLDWRFDSQLSPPHNAGPSARYNRLWTVKHNRRPGRYRAFISGWWNCKGVTVAQKMQECPNEPNWAFVRTGPVELTR